MFFSCTTLNKPLKTLTWNKNMNKYYVVSYQNNSKRGHSTATEGLAIQSHFARILDQGQFAMMASLDLSLAIDVVDITPNTNASLSIHRN